MYQAKIEAHNLNKIEVDPYPIQTLTSYPTLSELAEIVSKIVCEKSRILSNDFAITVTYTKMRE